ncbi:MAG: hypothetical protein HQ537_01615, partial [Parcubacteria group bacterium]|nr:hypothetical protein [Parcubacteria group bacterium]
MLPADKYYLKIGNAKDLKSPKERRIYRTFEILPGALAWLTLLSVIFLSWLEPIWVAFFIITFDVYWLLKTVYLSCHLRFSYKRMKKQIVINWMEKVESIKKKDWQSIHHLIILPAYKESVEVVRATFQAVIDSDYPKDKMIIVLA